MIIREITTKGILTRSNIPGVDLVVNPYIGCEHACIYCYAEFMKRFTNHHEPWGFFLDVKVNAPNLVKPRGKYRDKEVLLSSVTDPYTPHERKYKLTRKILEKLVPHQPKISILTKSELVVRDIDLFEKFKNIDIGISISTLNNEYTKQLEPRASLPFRRFNALQQCKEAGLHTHVFLSPIFPYITNIEEIMKTTVSYADYFMFENLNVRPNNRKRIFDFIQKNRPELRNEYQIIYNRPPDFTYWELMSKEIENLSKKYKKECQNCFHHGGFKDNEPRTAISAPL